MSRIPKVRCGPCNKVLYASEEQAREALGRVMVGRWKGEVIPDAYAFSVYLCPNRRRGWHLGRNQRVVRALEKWIEKHGETTASIK